MYSNEDHPTVNISLLYRRTKATCCTNCYLTEVCCDHGSEDWVTSLHTAPQYGGQICLSQWWLLLSSGGLPLKSLSLACICGLLALMNPSLFLCLQEIWCRETLCVCVKPPSSNADAVLSCSFPLPAGLEDSIAEIKQDCFVPMMWWPTKPLDETDCPSASPQSH